MKDREVDMKNSEPLAVEEKEERKGRTSYTTQQLLEKMYSLSRHDRRAFLNTFAKQDRKRFKGMYEKYRVAKIENREIVYEPKED